KAQLDERRSQEDLGTMISAAAESVPTLKLANLKEIAESGAPDPQETPAAIARVAEASDSAATRKREGSGSFSQSGSRRAAPPPIPPEPFEPTVAAGSTAPSRPAPTMPVRPISGVKPKSRAGWAVGLAAVVALALAGYVVLRRPSPPAPAAPASAPAAKPAEQTEAAAVQKSVDEGKRLFEAGKYEESL